MACGSRCRWFGALLLAGVLSAPCIAVLAHSGAGSAGHGTGVRPPFLVQSAPILFDREQSGSSFDEGSSRSFVLSEDKAIRRGLDYLAKQQDHNGSGTISQKYSVAVTALGGMAFLGHGAEYKRGKYGSALVRAVDYLLLRQDPSGYIHDGAEFPSRMHGHAYAILFLAQILGSIPEQVKEEKVRRAVSEGVGVILRSQTSRGGWGYEPDAASQRQRDADEGSITVCCLQALRAAKDAGIHVPDNHIDRALGYLKDSCKPDGSFRYSLARGSDNSTYELTAAAVSTLNAAGKYTSEEHKKGVSFMLEQIAEVVKNRKNRLDASSRWYYYGNLYAAQVFYQLGGEVWEAWAADAFPRLMKEQDGGSGAWKNSRFGDEYATAIALLILEVPMGYLPIFER